MSDVVLLSDNGQWMSVTVSQCCASRAWPTHIQRIISVDKYEADGVDRSPISVRSFNGCVRFGDVLISST